MSDYPKMLYLGPYRTQVTVETAEEEAAQRAAYGDEATPDAARIDVNPPILATPTKPPAAKATDNPKKATRR